MDTEELSRSGYFMAVYRHTSSIFYSNSIYIYFSKSLYISLHYFINFQQYFMMVIFPNGFFWCLFSRLLIICKPQLRLKKFQKLLRSLLPQILQVHQDFLIINEVSLSGIILGQLNFKQQDNI